MPDEVNDPWYCALRRRRLLEMLDGLPPRAWILVENSYVAQAIGLNNSQTFEDTLVSLADSTGCDADLREKNTLFKKRR